MSEDPSMAHPRRSLRGWLGTAWGRAVTLGAVLASAIGVVGIVLAVTEAAGRNDTTVESISVESEQVEDEPAARSGLPAVDGVSLDYYEGDRVHWAVPVDAPFGELLTAGGSHAGNGCTVEQVAWLEQYGIPLPVQLLRIDITNTATSGSRLVVSDIRAEGELSEPAVDVVMVSCERSIGGEPTPQYAELAIGTGEIAVYSEIEESSRDWYSDEAGEPGTPVVFDVAPGEAATLSLRYEHALDFRGRFVATVTVDGTESTLVLTPNGEDIFAPIVTIDTASLSILDMVPECWVSGTRVPGGQPLCDLARWESVLAEAMTEE
jgi:hypothetical protein